MKTISNFFQFVQKFFSWWRWWYSLVLISILLMLGYIFLRTVAFHIALLLFLLSILALALCSSKRLVNSIQLKGVFFLSFALSLIFTSWIVLWQTSKLPSNMNIKFASIYSTQPFGGENADVSAIDLIEKKIGEQSEANQNSIPINEFQDSIVGDVALVKVTVAMSKTISKSTRIYLLLHPHNTQSWYVQEELTYAPSETDQDNWEGYVYFGEPGKDCGLKFDLILLGSKENFLKDIFRGRGIRRGMQLDYLPILNQSEVITVLKSDKCK